MNGPSDGGGEVAAAWERWWGGIEGRPGEIVWDPGEADLAADLALIADAFDERLPLIDLGCGDGAQTRFLARRFRTVIGVDVSPSAIGRALAADRPSNASFRVLDATSAAEAERLAAKLGDANIYVRGVLQALPAANRPAAIGSIRALLGESGTLFAKELPPEASTYFARAIERHGMWPELERVTRLIPPGRITTEELEGLLSPDHFRLIGTGTGGIDTVNVLPDGQPIRVPAIWALARAR